MSNFNKQHLGVALCLIVCLILVLPSLMQPDLAPVAAAPPGPFTLSISINPSSAAGSVKMNNTGPYNYGDIVLLTETPNPGYTFASWSGDATGTGTVVTVNVTGVMSVSATFTQNTYTLSLTTVGSGSVSKNPDQPSYHYGDTVSLSATNSVSGWSFSGWTGGVTSSSNPLTVIINSSISIAATFTQNTYSVTYSALPALGGTVTANSTGPYQYNDGVILTETPNSGYSFSSWSGDGSGTGTTLTLTVTKNMAVTAIFTQTYQVAFQQSDGGTSSPSGTQTYTAGQQVPIAAVANSGYTFLSWSATPSNNIVFGNQNALSTTATINGPAIITPLFTQNSYTLSTNINGSGSVTVNPKQSSYLSGTSITLVATANPGWAFSGWSGSLTGLTNPSSVSINQNMIINATFVKSAYSISVSALPASGGTVTANATAPYHYGDVVMLTETPNSGYSFSGWNGDGVGTGSNRTVTVNGNMVVAASFSQITYKIVFASSTGGTTSPSDTQTYNASQLVPIVATPNNGYTFLSWSASPSGSVTFSNSQAASTNATINGACNITATFTLSPTATPTASPGPSPTPTSTSNPSQPTPTTSPTTSPQPTATPLPTPIPNTITINALTDSGKNASLTFQGGITSSSISGISINTDGSNTTTTISLAIVAQSNTNGFDNVTIPISAVPYGTIPTVYVNNGVAQNQGYSHDSKNYYVWFKTGYSTYELSIAFQTQPAPSDFPLWATIVIIGIVIASIVLVMLKKNLINIRFKLPAFPKIT